MRFFTLCLLFFVTLGLTAQDKNSGIHYESKPFDEILAQAKAEDKIIFAYAYSPWMRTGPMDIIAEVCNTKFVNIQFNAEKAEGKALAKHYSIVAWPSYLFINSDGEVIHRAHGVHLGKGLLELVNTVRFP